jgi:long-subunit fatty acid transport protein
MFVKQQKIIGLVIVCIALINNPIWCKAASLIEIPGTFNPVGSGARAIGMGGAFMGIADDATASSWNPAALIHLKKPELSFVFSHDHLQEKNKFAAYPESTGNQPVSKISINYLSAVYPVAFSGKNMVLAASAQRLYSLSRRWHFPFQQNTDIESYRSQYAYAQKGDLYALGLSWCMEIVQPQLSVGITLNKWADGFIGDDWTRTNHVSTKGIFDNHPYIEKQDISSSYSFEGWNAMLGMIWNINEQWQIGAVLKTPFNATVHEDTQINYFFQSTLDLKKRPTQYVSQESSLEMPLTWGFGLLYRVFDNFYLAADFYETHWHHFLLRTGGHIICPLSGQTRNTFQMDRTYQVRIGGEYVWVDPVLRRLIPFRFGCFYDPMPSENNGDDIYGFSLGTGWTILDQFSIDIAYQFRYGNDVGGHFLSNLGFSQDIRESKVYCSLIVY